MSVVVDISPQIREWIVRNYLDLQNLDIKEQQRIVRWLEGSERFTFKKIEELSKKTKVPLGYFFLESPPMENISLFASRTHKSIAIDKPSRDLMDTFYHMMNIQDWMREHQIENGYGIVPFVGSARPDQDYLEIVTSIRSVLGISDNWFDDFQNSDQAYKFIRKQLQDQGVVVMESGIVGSNTRRALTTDEFRAFVLMDEYAPLVFINSTDSKTGKLFSLLHEVVHIWLGVENLFNVGERESLQSTNLEMLCNRVASEILVPESVFIDLWHQSHDYRNVMKRFEMLASHFNCSSVVIARRALDCDFIKKDCYLKIVEESKQNFDERKKTPGGDYYRTKQAQIDNRFLNALISSVWEGKTLYMDAYSLTKTTGKSFTGLVERLKGNGAL